MLKKRRKDWRRRGMRYVYNRIREAVWQQLRGRWRKFLRENPWGKRVSQCVDGDVEEDVYVGASSVSKCCKLDLREVLNHYRHIQSPVLDRARLWIPSCWSIRFALRAERNDGILLGMDLPSLFKAFDYARRKRGWRMEGRARHVE